MVNKKRRLLLVSVIVIIVIGGALFLHYNDMETETPEENDEDTSEEDIDDPFDEYAGPDDLAATTEVGDSEVGVVYKLENYRTNVSENETIISVGEVARFINEEEFPVYLTFPRDEVDVEQPVIEPGESLEMRFRKMVDVVFHNAETDEEINSVMVRAYE